MASKLVLVFVLCIFVCTAGLNLMSLEVGIGNLVDLSVDLAQSMLTDEEVRVNAGADCNDTGISSNAGLTGGNENTKLSKYYTSNL